MRRIPQFLVAAALLVAACETNTIVDPPPPPPPAADGPEYLGATVAANDLNTVSAEVVVQARDADSAFVRFWTGDEQPMTSPPYGFGGDSVALVPVLGLDTNATYAIAIGVWFGDSLADAVDTLEFTSGALPDWIPLAGTSGSDTTPGFVALSYPDGPVIVDNTGRVVWYRYFPNGTLNSFQAHPNGRYTVLGLDDTTDAFHVLDELGREVDLVHCVGYSTRFHDLLIEADGSAWVLCNDTRLMDLSGVGGVDSANVTATVLQQIRPNGTVGFEWNAFDHFEITDLPANSRSGPNVNFTHGNGIARDTDGNFLLSFRSLNEVTKIHAGTGEVLWRFGGLRSQFTILNDAKGVFEWQHGVRPAGPGIIQLLDNGFAAPSRLLRYLLNPSTGTALAVVEFIDDPTTHTHVGGGTQYYASNSHGLVTFGVAGRVVEIDESGNRAWELTGIDGTYVFRAQRIPSLYPREW